MESKSRTILKTTDRGVKTVEAWWSFLKTVWDEGKPFLGLLLPGAALIGGALQSVFQWISQYGWAGWVFAGVAGLVSVCVLSIIVSAVWYVALLVRDRRRGRDAHDFQPSTRSALMDNPEWLHAIPDQLTGLRKRLDELSQALGASEAKHQSFEEFRAELLELKKRVSKTDDSLRPKPGGLLSGGQTFETRLDAIEAMVQGARDYTSGAVNGLVHTMDQRKIIQDQFNETILTSLRSRDALEILRKADFVAMELGNKLISAETYENGAAWSKDHNEWGHSLSQIDGLLAMWWGEEHRDLIEVKHYQYESEKRTAPPHIFADEGENYRRYKHVCISHDRYLNVRRDVFAYFQNKAHNLPH